MRVPPLDDALEIMEVFYIRFMDDWVVLATTRHRLRKAVRVVNQCLESLQVSQHPNKTFVGRTSKGFDFLGSHFQRYQISKGCMICVIPKKETSQKTSIKPYRERPGKTCQINIVQFLLSAPSTSSGILLLDGLYAYSLFYFRVTPILIHRDRSLHLLVIILFHLLHHQ